MSHMIFTVSYAARKRRWKNRDKLGLQHEDLPDPNLNPNHNP